MISEQAVRYQSDRPKSGSHKGRGTWRGDNMISEQAVRYQSDRPKSGSHKGRGTWRGDNMISEQAVRYQSDRPKPPFFCCPKFTIAHPSDALPSLPHSGQNP